MVDVGHSIELFADFSGTGKNYVQFPDSLNHRISHQQLALLSIRERLRAVWLDPHCLELKPYFGQGDVGCSRAFGRAGPLAGIFLPLHCRRAISDALYFYLL